MKNRLLLIILSIILTSFYLSAQLSFKTDSLFSIESPPSEDAILVTNYLYNNSSESITYKWYRSIENIPSTWSAAVCDATTCWSPTTMSTPLDNLISIEPGDSTKVELNFFNEGRTGEGYAEVIAFDIADSANTVVTAIFVGKSEFAASVSINENMQEKINIYPNPAQNTINLKGLENVSSNATIEIYSIIGVKVAEVEYSRNSIDVSAFQSGVYLLKVSDKNKSYSQTFIKQ